MTDLVLHKILGENFLAHESNSTHLPSANGNIQKIPISWIHLQINGHFNTIQTYRTFTTRKILNSFETLLIINPQHLYPFLPIVCKEKRAPISLRKLIASVEFQTCYRMTRKTASGISTEPAFPWF